MKLTQTLLYYHNHNLYRYTHRQWFYQSKHRVDRTNMEGNCKRCNITVHDAMKIAKEVRPRLPPVTIVGPFDRPPKLDESHPDWHLKPCMFYRDHNVLVDGLNQAKVFTNSVEIKTGLPENIVSLYNEIKTDEHEGLIQMALASSTVYDATQDKLLPRRKDPQRRAYKFPRDYGIPDYRRNYLLCHKFLHISELIAGLKLSENRMKFEDAFFSVPLERDDVHVQLQIRADLLLLADQRLKPICNPEDTLGTKVPYIAPITCTASLEDENIYYLENIYPVNQDAKFRNVHTAMIHFNETEVKNLYALPVFESQTMSRSLMKAFTIAAAQARFLYGKNVNILPEPIVVQCIQTDAKYFHFSVFQLNNLTWPPSDAGVRNVFWHETITSAYEFAGYNAAKPSITSYNSDIFKKFLAFYLNN